MISKSELEILKMLSKEWKSEDEIKENKDKIRRTCYFLSEKGFVEMKQEEVIKEKLNKKAQDLLALYDRLEDQTPINQIPSFAIGPFKELGLIQNNRFIKKQVNFEDYFRQKDYYDLEIEKVFYYRLTDKGLEALEQKPGEVVVTVESLQQGNLTTPNISNLEPLNIGREHIISIWKNKIKKIFSAMGFIEMYGPYVELSYWNFDALFQPQDHPSRELADTFYLPIYKDIEYTNVKDIHEKYWKNEWKEDEARKLVLRTHTTVLSAKYLSKYKRGKFFAIGKVFRNEAIDYKHLAEFHQIEGIVADKNLNFKHLLGVLKRFYSYLDLSIRFRPSYFPYTEPSVEIEAYFPSRNSWIEIGGAGIFRKQVSEILNCEYPVLAFGLSLERTIMLFSEVDDIRDLYYKPYSIRHPSSFELDF
jgi:phenylalanyl-tRNA synthetase alpha subunit